MNLIRSLVVVDIMLVYAGETQVHGHHILNCSAEIFSLICTELIMPFFAHTHYS